MHKPSDTDFTVSVDGVGDFTFARRTLGDSIKIRRDYLRLCGGEEGEKDLEISCYANITATVGVLCVSAPAGWEDPEKLDMTASPDVLDQLLTLYDKLKEKEDSFRRPANSTGTT